MLQSRDELIATLFRETDRAQRMKTPLALILIGIDEWETWRLRFDQRVLDDAALEIAGRVARFLRCYDAVGRYGDGEFVLVLPGCTSFNAVSMAERLSQDAFGSSLRLHNEEIRFSACFGVAGSGGRSPLVVLRNAEQAFKIATARGAGSIERCAYDAEPDPAAFLIQIIQDDALHW